MNSNGNYEGYGMDANGMPIGGGGGGGGGQLDEAKIAALLPGTSSSLIMNSGAHFNAPAGILDGLREIKMMPVAGEEKAVLDMNGGIIDNATVEVKNFEEVELIEFKKRDPVAEFIPKIEIEGGMIMNFKELLFEPHVGPHTSEPATFGNCNQFTFLGEDTFILGLHMLKFGDVEGFEEKGIITNCETIDVITDDVKELDEKVGEFDGRITSNTDNIAACVDTCQGYHVAWAAAAGGAAILAEGYALKFMSGGQAVGNISKDAIEFVGADATQITAALVKIKNILMNQEGLQCGESVAVTEEGVDIAEGAVKLGEAGLEVGTDVAVATDVITAGSTALNVVDDAVSGAEGAIATTGCIATTFVDGAYHVMSSVVDGIGHLFSHHHKSHVATVIAQHNIVGELFLREGPFDAENANAQLKIEYLDNTQSIQNPKIIVYNGGTGQDFIFKVQNISSGTEKWPGLTSVRGTFELGSGEPGQTNDYFPCLFQQTVNRIPANSQLDEESVFKIVDNVNVDPHQTNVLFDVHITKNPYEDNIRCYAQLQTYRVTKHWIPRALFGESPYDAFMIHSAEKAYMRINVHHSDPEQDYIQFGVPVHGITPGPPELPLNLSKDRNTSAPQNLFSIDVTGEQPTNLLEVYAAPQRNFDYVNVTSTLITQRYVNHWYDRDTQPKVYFQIASIDDPDTDKIMKVLVDTENDAGDSIEISAKVNIDNELVTERYVKHGFTREEGKEIEVFEITEQFVDEPDPILRILAGEHKTEDVAHFYSSLETEQYVIHYFDRPATDAVEAFSFQVPSGTLPRQIFWITVDHDEKSNNQDEIHMDAHIHCKRGLQLGLNSDNTTYVEKRLILTGIDEAGQHPDIDPEVPWGNTACGIEAIDTLVNDSKFCLPTAVSSAKCKIKTQPYVTRLVDIPLHSRLLQTGWDDNHSYLAMLNNTKVKTDGQVRGGVSIPIGVNPTQGNGIPIDFSYWRQTHLDEIPQPSAWEYGTNVSEFGFANFPNNRVGFAANTIANAKSCVVESELTGFIDLGNYIATGTLSPGPLEFNFRFHYGWMQEGKGNSIGCKVNLPQQVLRPNTDPPYIDPTLPYTCKWKVLITPEYTSNQLVIAVAVVDATVTILQTSKNNTNDTYWHVMGCLSFPYAAERLFNMHGFPPSFSPQGDYSANPIHAYQFRTGAKAQRLTTTSWTRDGWIFEPLFLDVWNEDETINYGTFKIPVELTGSIPIDTGNDIILPANSTFFIKTNMSFGPAWYDYIKIELGMCDDDAFYYNQESKVFQCGNEPYRFNSYVWDEPMSDINLYNDKYFASHVEVFQEGDHQDSNIKIRPLTTSKKYAFNRFD
jgi:hypothetical protein